MRQSVQALFKVPQTIFRQHQTLLLKILHPIFKTLLQHSVIHFSSQRQATPFKPPSLLITVTFSSHSTTTLFQIQTQPKISRLETSFKL
jgi:hypothetical protein